MAQKIICIFQTEEFFLNNKNNEEPNSLLCRAHPLFFVACASGTRRQTFFRMHQISDGPSATICNVYGKRPTKPKCVTVCSHSWAVLIACEVTRDGISLSPLLLQGFSPSSELQCHAQRSHPRSGSSMPCSGSQVKEMVMAKRVPH